MATHTYRAACGLERTFTPDEQKVYKTKFSKFEATPTKVIVMGWRGDEKAENERLRTDKETPEECKTCPHRTSIIEHIWSLPQYPMAAVCFYQCDTFRLVKTED